MSDTAGRDPIFPTVDPAVFTAMPLADWYELAVERLNSNGRVEESDEFLRLLDEGLYWATASVDYDRDTWVNLYAGTEADPWPVGRIPAGLVIHPQAQDAVAFLAVVTG